MYYYKRMMTEPQFGYRAGIKKIDCTYYGNGICYLMELVSNAYNLECAYLNRKPDKVPQELYDIAVMRAEAMMGGPIRKLTA